MPTLVHLLATIIFASAVAAILYWIIRRYERKLGRECAVIFAVFGSALISVASIKTNSPPARAIRNVVSGIVGAFTEGYPYDRETWPFDETTEAAVAGRASTEVPPIPDDMTATGVAVYRIGDGGYSPESFADTARISEWAGIDADNRGICADLPFAFPFNGITYTNVGILSNGRIALGYATRHRRASGGLPIGYPGGLEIVAPFWGNHLLTVADNASVTTLATSNTFGIVWENLSTPVSGTTSNTTVACVLRDDGRMSWHYSPVHPSVVSNVTVGVQSGTNAWMLVNGGAQTNMASLLSQTLAIELAPVGGAEWAFADADGDDLTNLEEFMLGTNPNLADTDGDGPGDRWELEHGYPPDSHLPPDELPDTDGDGVPDIWETRIGTDPLSVTTDWPCADSDGDGFLDAYEAHIGSDPGDSANPPFPDEESEQGLVSCQIDSSLPCWLVMAYDDDVQRTNEVRLAWVPGVSPENVFLLLDASRRASVYLEREETNGYWRTSLDVSVCHVSSVSKTQSADADAYTAPGSQSGLRGGRGGGSSWVPPGDKVGDGYGIEYWRFLLPSESIDFCHNLGYAEILLPSLIGYDGTISWSIEPDGPSGTGNPIMFCPNDLAPSAYEITISIEPLEGTLEKTITLNVRSLSVTTHRIIVDANDTTTHYLPIDYSGTFIPNGEDFEVISSPAGIDSIDFVPADLTPGTTYTVDIWNGDCGYQTIDVIAVEMKVEPQALFPDYLRSDLGVGEVLDCSIEPANLNVSWSCTTGKAQFASPNASSTTLSVLDVPGGLTVTASIEGVALSTNYVVHAPEGIAYSKPHSPDSYDGYMRAGAGCDLYVTVAPTNVAFCNVWIEEGYSDAFKVSGYFSSAGNHPPHDRSKGAFSEIKLKHLMNDGYYFEDSMGTGKIYPWSAGYMEWRIPASWWISNGLSSTNLHSFGDAWVESFRIDDDGTTTVSKFESTVKRFTDDHSILTDSKGVVQ